MSPMFNETELADVYYTEQTHLGGLGLHISVSLPLLHLALNIAAKIKQE